MNIHRTNRAGFTLTELLIAISLMAGIMASLGMVIQGASLSETKNRELMDVTQSARLVLNRMMREVRLASDVEIASGTLKIVSPAGSTADSITYYLDSSDGGFYYQVTTGASSETYNLLSPTDRVTLSDFQIALTYDTATTTEDADEDGNLDTVTYVSLVTVELELTSGTRTETVQVSAVPRAAYEQYGKD